MMDFAWNFFTNVANYRFMFVTPWPTKSIWRP